MKFKIPILGVLFLFVLSNVNCQDWIKIYGDTVNTEVLKVWEHYDKGYMFTGQRDEGWSYYGWLMKSDINGEVIWSKAFGITSKMNQFVSSRITPDGGLILCGSTNNLSTSCTDPLIVKVNACGEKEWCKIYNAQSCNSWVKDVEVLHDMGYIALIDRWQSGEDKRIWLFRLNSLGEVIWAQVYATNPDFWSEISHSLLMTTDSCFVITGEAYYPDPTYPDKKIIKIILIKVKLDGESIFEVPWGTNNGVYSDGRLSTIDSKNNIYTAGRRARTIAPYGDSPCLFKTSVNGNPVFYKDLKTNSVLGIATTINWFQDSTLVQCMYWGSQVGNDTTGLIKTDSLGNYITTKYLLLNSACSFYGSEITYNNKLILAGSVFEGGVYHSYAYKFNTNLEYDSIYTAQFNYDSLCPHPIISDTIPLDDCQVVMVGIDEPIKNPEKARLHVYPNPAKNNITIEFPQYLIRQSKGQGLTATTYYHQWKSSTLEIYDLFGKLMFSKEILKQTKTVELDISSWHAGMYMARLVFINEVVATAKFVVE